MRQVSNRIFKKKILAISWAIFFLVSSFAFEPAVFGAPKALPNTSIRLISPCAGSKRVPADSSLEFDLPASVIEDLPEQDQEEGHSPLHFFLIIQEKKDIWYATDLDNPLLPEHKSPKEKASKTETPPQSRGQSKGPTIAPFGLWPGQFVIDKDRSIVRFEPLVEWKRGTAYTVYLFVFGNDPASKSPTLLATSGPQEFRTLAARGKNGSHPNPGGGQGSEPGTGSGNHPKPDPKPDPDTDPPDPDNPGDEDDPTLEDPGSGSGDSNQPGEHEGDGPIEDDPETSAPPRFDSWMLLEPVNLPPPREGSACVLDPVRQRIYRLLGEHSAGAEDDAAIWEYRLSDNTWAAVQTVPENTPPAASYLTAVFEPDLARAYIWGGLRETGLTTGTTYSFDPSTGLVQLKAGHDRRMRHSAAFIPETKRWIIFGGRGDSLRQYFNTAICYTLPDTPWSPGTWNDVAISGDEIPAPRAGHDAVFDPVSKKMFVFGGIRRLDSGAYPTFNDLWAFEFTEGNAGTWQPMNPEGNLPSPRHGHRMLFLPESRSILLFGGQSQVNGYHPSDEVPMNGEYLDDMWIYDIEGNTWTRLDLPGPKPSPRSYFSLMKDPENSRIYLMGGKSPDGPKNDLWVLPVS
jgi:hypothetical protein